MHGSAAHANYQEASFRYPFPVDSMATPFHLEALSAPFHARVLPSLFFLVHPSFFVSNDTLKMERLRKTILI